MAKINIESISIRNFGSFGDTPVEFKYPNKGIYRVIGKNLDIDPDSIGTVDLQVGSGKSIWFSALPFAIFGDTQRKVNKDSLINKKTKKNLHVSLIFSKDKQRYKIDRYRKHSKYSNRLFFFKEENGAWADISREDLALTQEYINSIFESNLDVILKTTVLARDGNRNFLEMPTHERTAVIENIIQIEKLKKYLNRIKEKLRGLKKSYEENNYEISEISGSYKTLKGLIKDDIKNRKQKRKKIRAEISDCEEKIKSFSEKSYDEKSLKAIEESYEQYKEICKELENVREAKNESLNEKNPSALTYSIKKFSELRDEILEFRKALDVLYSEKGEKCYYCSKIIKEEDHKLKIQKQEKKLQEFLKEKQQVWKTIKSRYKTYQSIVDKFNDLSSKENSIILKYKKEFKNIQEIKDKIKKIDDLNNTLNELNKTLQVTLSIENILLLRKKYKEKNKALNILLQKKEELSEQIKIGEFWDAAFDFRNEGSIKSYLIKKIIPVFNGILDNFITIMFNGQLTVAFDSTFQETIHYNGEFFDYGELSTGEKAKLNLCIAFTIFNLTKMNLVSLNVMFIDEMFAGMDSETIKKFLNIIKNNYSKNLAVFIVGYEHGLDHHLMADKTITIKKENSLSSLLIS